MIRATLLILLFLIRSFLSTAQNSEWGIGYKLTFAFNGSTQKCEVYDQVLQKTVSTEIQGTVLKFQNSFAVIQQNKTVYVFTYDALLHEWKGSFFYNLKIGPQNVIIQDGVVTIDSDKSGLVYLFYDYELHKWKSEEEKSGIESNTQVFNQMGNVIYHSFNNVILCASYDVVNHLWRKHYERIENDKISVVSFSNGLVGLTTNNYRCYFFFYDILEKDWKKVQFTYNKEIFNVFAMNYGAGLVRISPLLHLAVVYNPEQHKWNIDSFKSGGFGVFNSYFSAYKLTLENSNIGNIQLGFKAGEWSSKFDIIYPFCISQNHITNTDTPLLYCRSYDIGNIGNKITRIDDAIGRHFIYLSNGYHLFQRNGLTQIVTQYYVTNVHFDCEVKLTASNTQKINSIEEHKLFPNPAISGQDIFIKGETEINKIEVYNGIGKCCLIVNPKTNSGQISFSTGGFPKGIYFLKIYDSNNGAGNRKIVIQ